MADEYIKRAAAVEWFMPYVHTGESIEADVAPVMHARWKDSDFIKGMLTCTNCGAQRNPNFKIGGGAWNYCPACGAKMDMEDKE